ncbi:RDD family protein [Streptomyces sp. NPDC059631]|uniref:RDD family protein n=1 Tax=unclassified Streptomyces TaxID=2593676 RepID=UPI00367EF149
MSAPTPAPGDDRPREGYYPDPSIPGYVRYWNGSSWVPGTSRPAPADGEPLSPPPGARPAASATPAVEETGPHFFDEDPPPAAARPEPAAAPWSGDPDPHTPWTAPAGPDPRVAHANSPAGEGDRGQGQGQGQGQVQGQVQGGGAAPAQDGGGSAGTFVFRRPTAADAPANAAAPAAPAGPGIPGPGGPVDDGTMTFRPVPRSDPPQAASGQPSVPAQGAHSPAPAQAQVQPQPQPQGPAQQQGPVRAQPPSPAQGHPQPHGPAQAAGPAPAHVPVPASPAPAPAAPVAPVAPLPHQAAAPPHAAAVPGSLPSPVAGGPGGGQASWAQQVHQLAGAGAGAGPGAAAEEQPVAPWKPPVEDVFQAAARRQAAARPAGLGRRLAARLVDTVLLAGVTAVAAVPLGTRAVDHVDAKIDAAKLTGRTVTVWLLDGTTAAYLGVVLAVLLLAGVLYEVLPTAKWGRTLGKKLCGLQVRDIEGHEPPSFGPALRRWLVYSVPGLLGVGIVGVLWCLFDRPWHQCWHDKAAHTFVAD